MTNNTINVPRELLENIVLCYNEGEFELGTLAAECHAILSAPSPANHVEDVRAMVDAPSPAGVDGWISVSERLPGEDDQVLCWCEDETVAWAEVSSHHNSFFTDMTHELLPVTHWMPLPAAPIKIEASRHDQ